MKRSRTARRLPGMILLTLLLPILGCSGFKDWMEPSGSESRSSPVIGNLIVVPVSVFCGEGNPLGYSFDYSDPQDDIFLVRITAKRTAQPDWTEERSALWSELDLSTTPGRAFGEFFFTCSAPSGTYTLTIVVEDDRGHLSNELSTEVTLL